MIDLNTMRRAEFYALPARKWDDTTGEFQSLVLLPMRGKHDSGYGFIDVVGVNQKAEVPMIRLSGCSDVVNLNGGTYAGWLAYSTQKHPCEWCIDLLYRSKLFNLFTHRAITVGAALSSLYCYGGTSR